MAVFRFVFFKDILSVNIPEKGYRLNLEIFRDDRSREVEDVLRVKRIERHFRSSQKVVEEIEIFKIFILKLNLYQFIRSLLMDQKIIGQPETDSSTCGNRQKTFHFLDFRCPKSRLFFR